MTDFSCEIKRGFTFFLFGFTREAKSPLSAAFPHAEKRFKTNMYRALCFGVVGVAGVVGATAACMQENPKSLSVTHHSVVIIGGGTAGLTVGAQLMNKKKDLDLCVVEPSQDHYYQPLWTLVGGGLFKKGLELFRTLLAKFPTFPLHRGFEAKDAGIHSQRSNLGAGFLANC